MYAVIDVKTAIFRVINATGGDLDMNDILSGYGNLAAGAEVDLCHKDTAGHISWATVVRTRKDGESKLFKLLAAKDLQVVEEKAPRL